MTNTKLGVGVYFHSPLAFSSKPQWPSRPDPLGSCFPVQEKLCNEILFQFVDYPWEYRHACFKRLQKQKIEQVTISSSRDLPNPGIEPVFYVSYIGIRVLYH